MPLATVDVNESPLEIDLISTQAVCLAKSHTRGHDQPKEHLKRRVGVKSAFAVAPLGAGQRRQNAILLARFQAPISHLVTFGNFIELG